MYMAKLLHGSICHTVRGRPRPRPHCVTWGSSFPLTKRHSNPQFSAHVCCVQTAGWIKMSLAVGVGLGPGHIVLDGDSSPKGHSPSPIFSPCLFWLNGWMNQDTTWYGVMPRPRRHCVRWGSSCPIKGGTAPPTFWPMSIVAKRSLISATAELLLNYCSLYQVIRLESRKNVNKHL